MIQPGQKTITLHFCFILLHLHDERSAEVHQVGIADVWKQHIAETLRMFFPEMIKICLPEKINKQREPARWAVPVIIFFEMIVMKKFNVLHRNKINNSAAQKTQICMSGEPLIN